VADRSPAAAHVEHDLLLVATWAADDSEPAALARAADQVAGCRECAALADDVRAIQAATSAWPPAPRNRDFRLTPADAARLRSRRGWLGDLRSRGDLAFVRPLAGAMTALGLAGLLLTTLPVTGPAGGQTSDAASRLQSVGSADPQPAAAPAAGSAAAVASDNAIESYQESPVPGDAAAPSAAAFGPARGGLDASTTSPPQRQATPDRAPEAASAPEAAPASDLVRPAVAAGSAVLIGLGLVLLVLTRRRRPDEA